MFMTWSSSGPSTFISEVVAARKSTDGAGIAADAVGPVY